MITLVAALGAAPTTSKPASYSSTGVIRIRRLPADTDVQYEAIAASQVVLLKSGRILDLALQTAEKSEAWKDAGAPSRTDLEKSLDITRDVGVIRVTFTHANAAVAQEAVRDVIGAYQKVVTQVEGGAASEMKNVAQLRDDYVNKMKGQDQEILILTDGKGVAAVAAQYMAAIEQADAAQKRMQKAREAIETARASNTQTPGAVSAQQLADLEADQAAARKAFNTMQTEVLRQGTLAAKIKSIQINKQIAQTYFDSANDRLAKLAPVAEQPSRIDVVSTGDTPRATP